MFYPVFQSKREYSALKPGGMIYDESQAPAQTSH
jgi:hypothetical protein